MSNLINTRVPTPQEQSYHEMMAKVGNQTDAFIAKLDTNKDKAIDAKELEALLAYFPDSYSSSSVARELPEGFWEDLEASRKTMTEDQRFATTTINAGEKLPVDDHNPIALAALQGAARGYLDQAIKSLDGANVIAMMLILATLPTDAYKWVKTEVYGRA